MLSRRSRWPHRLEGAVSGYIRPGFTIALLRQAIRFRLPRHAFRRIFAPYASFESGDEVLAVLTESAVFQQIGQEGLCKKWVVLTKIADLA